MKTFYMVAALVGLLVALDSNIDTTAEDVMLLQTMEAVREDNAEITDSCVLVAAHILVGRYDEVEHMMISDGKCATRVVGLRVKVDYTGS